MRVIIAPGLFVMPVSSVAAPSKRATGSEVPGHASDEILFSVS